MENLWRHKELVAAYISLQQASHGDTTHANYSGINGVLLAMQSQLKSDELPGNCFFLGRHDFAGFR